MYELRNLVFLMHTANVCYATAKRKKPADVDLDLTNGRWSYRGRTHKIGESRYCEPQLRQAGAMIGVYDRTDDAHLDNMLHAAHEAMSPQVSALAVD